MDRSPYDGLVRQVEVTVPATSANLGPGFDSMGLALDLWNTFALRIDGTDAGIRVDVNGEGEGILPRDGSHLSLATMLEDLAGAGLPAPESIRLTCTNHVPCASGLGSSSSAILAGLVFAGALRLAAGRGRPIRSHEVDLDAIVSRAVDIEGHGDNVTPAVRGGLQVVYTHGTEYRNRAIPIPPTRVVICVPDYAYLTSQARAALPPSIRHSDAVFNIGHAMLVCEALRSQDDVLLADALRDRLHEQYRVRQIPGAARARAAGVEAGAIAVCLSGAGPGLLAFTRSGHDAVGEAMVSAFAWAGLRARYWVLDASGGGMRVSVS